MKEQTSNNWECIIIDDCSTDNSVLTIKSVIKNNDKFKLYINNKIQEQIIVEIWDTRIKR